MRTKAEIDETLLKNSQDALEACMTVDGEMGKRLRRMIFQELKNARNSIVEGIKFDNGDPRGTRHSIKRYMAGKYLGGVVSIASHGAKASGMKNSYEAPRTLRPGQRGGNRVARGFNTQRSLDYGPQDRAFILNFVNAGTKVRYSGYGRNGRTGRAYEKYIERTGGRGHRGQIAPRNFMDTLGKPAMQRAVENLERMVDEEFNKLFK